MNYGDHNFIEIKQQTKLRVALVVSSQSSQSSSTCRASGPVKLVVSSESSCAVRQCRHCQNAWARHVERVARHVERVESSQVEFGLYIQFCVK